MSIHRKHHARCETADDPHSPQTRGLKKVLWEGAELYMVEAANKETLTKFGHGTPNDWLEKNVYSRYTWHGLGRHARRSISSCSARRASPSGRCR